MKKPTDAGQPGAQGDAPDPSDPPGPADSPGPKTTESRAELEQRLRRLKPGHPSSPYDADGIPKPDPVNLSELESDSDADGHDYNPADQDADHARQDADHADHADHAENAGRAEDRASEGWRTALPQLQARWERHEERWPAEQRPPVDRSKDAPGSWRGDTGDYLSYEENLLAEHELGRVRQAEPEISKTMQAIEAEVPNVRLVGLQYCLKGEDRFKEKVAREVLLKPDRSLAEIAERMPDAIRYTLECSEEGYVDSYRGICSQLEERGNDLVLRRNSWDDPDYKGINTRWLTGDGQMFEVQIHTADSFQAKQLTHVAYERLRSRPAADAERPELESFQQRVTSNVPVPHGVEAITDYRKEGY